MSDVFSDNVVQPKRAKKCETATSSTEYVVDTHMSTASVGSGNEDLLDDDFDNILASISSYELNQSKISASKTSAPTLNLSNCTVNSTFS
jgi:hypothetical protein